MEISLGAYDHEQVVFCHEPLCGYRGIIAIHNTVLGPALGGTRYWNYDNDQQALMDVLRLSRGMTYKASVAGLNLGGGKAIIIGDPRRTNREEIFRAHGRFVNTLKGRFITAEDVGTSADDMEFVAMETEHVTGRAQSESDPSPVTAYGVYRGIKAAAQACYGTDSLEGKVITVQGAGHVGYYLCQNLASEGARIIVADVLSERVDRIVNDFDAKAVAPDEIYSVEADIFAPCAMGSSINDDTLSVLKVAIVAGAANNVLAEERHAAELQNGGILYAPDYVINAGGLINVYGELNGWVTERAMRKAGDIYATLLRIFELSVTEGIPTSTAADRIAEQRIQSIGKQRGRASLFHVDVARGADSVRTKFEEASKFEEAYEAFRFEEAFAEDIGVGSGGYIIVDLPDAQKSLFHDLLKGFEDFAKLKGYKVLFSIDSSLSNKIAFKFTLADEGFQVSGDRVRRDINEYIHRVRSGDTIDDLPILISPSEYNLVLTTLKNRLSFLQHSYALERNASEFYQRMLAGVAALSHASVVAPSVVVHTGGQLDARQIHAVNSSHILQDGGASYIDQSVENRVTIGESFKERAEQIQLVERVMQILREDGGNESPQSQRITANLLKVKDELTEEPEPDRKRISQWLTNIKSLLETTKISGEITEIAIRLLRTFGLG